MSSSSASFNFLILDMQYMPRNQELTHPFRVRKRGQGRFEETVEKGIERSRGALAERKRASEEHRRSMREHEGHG